jgi:cysteinyl-tRNA synthetase
MPKALALMWEVVKNEKLKIKDKKDLLFDFDKVFGLDLAKIKKPKIPEEIKKLVKGREEYRKKGDFESADEIRKQIKEMGWQIEDTSEGPKIKKL